MAMRIDTAKSTRKEIGLRAESDVRRVRMQMKKDTSIIPAVGDRGLEEKDVEEKRGKRTKGDCAHPGADDLSLDERKGVIGSHCRRLSSERWSLPR
jgi:hypothetical protein